MVQIPATEVTLGQLKQGFGLRQTQDPNFFSEWLETSVSPPPKPDEGSNTLADCGD